MAAIDFSNAVVERVGLWNLNSIYTANLGLMASSFYSLDSVLINEGSSVTVLDNTTDKLTVLYSGRIKSDVPSGNAFTLYSGSNKTWKISNISYNPGDTYSFTIEIDLSNL